MAAFSQVRGSHIYLLTLLLAGFLLMALTDFQRRTRRWEATGVDYPELRLETAAAAIFMSLALVTTAEIVPSISVQRIVELAREVGGGRSEEARAVAESLGMEQRQTTVLEEVRTGGLPRRHLVGSGPELSERVVMFVSTGDLPPGPPEATDREPPRYRWRSHTYDRYTGSGWQTADTETVAYAAGTPAITETLPEERVVRQAVRVVGDAGALLHAAGTLKVADHDYWVAWRSPEDPFGAMIDATSYRADSLLAVADEQGLRAESSDYPGWVRERYLALPETVPARVLALARDLTATEPTPYERARAIETYLRQFPYTLDVPQPPSDRDVVDTFLFDLQRGYCDYYASAMTVLARAAGLPARLAVGYASGAYDWEEARYVVTEADAHAWPEVYFPNHGWVAFEPTAGLPPLEHADDAASPAWAEPEDALEPAARGWGVLRWTWWRALAGAMTLLALAAAGWRALDRQRLLRQRPVVALASLYGRLRAYGRRLGVPMQAGDTPHEFGASFASWMERLAPGRARELAGSGGRSPSTGRRGRGALTSGGGRLASAITVGGEELLALTGLYARVRYSTRSLETVEQADAVRLWGRLRWRLLLARLWSRWRIGKE
jgi:transglutaminase-like putative cysteine protease